MDNDFEDPPPPDRHNEQYQLTREQRREVRARYDGVSQEQELEWEQQRADTVADEEVDEEGPAEVETDTIPIGLGGPMPSPEHMKECKERAKKYAKAWGEKPIESVRDLDMKDYIDALHEGGWNGLIDEIVRREHNFRVYPEDYIENTLKPELAQIFLSMDSDVLLSHIKGDLSHRYIVDPHIKKELDKIRKRWPETYKGKKAGKQPGIYHQALVDKCGFSPTPEQLQKVIDWIRKHYLASFEEGSDPALVSKIDSFRGEPFTKDNARKGFRKFFMNKITGGTWKHISSRPHQLKMFCDRLEERLKHEPKGIPLEAPLVEVGYTDDFTTRLRSHRRHRNSNFIQNLFESVCAHLFGDKFRIDQHYLYLCWKPIHAGLAEIGLSALPQGFIHNGGGFSHEPAGLSIKSCYKYKAEDYHKWRAWNLNNMPYYNNIKVYKLWWPKAAVKFEVGEDSEGMKEIARLEARTRALRLAADRWDATEAAYSFEDLIPGYTDPDAEALVQARNDVAAHAQENAHLDSEDLYSATPAAKRRRAKGRAFADLSSSPVRGGHESTADGGSYTAGHDFIGGASSPGAEGDDSTMMHGALQ